jgi:hypothetical protein
LKRNRILYSTLCLLFLFGKTFSQSAEKIKFKKTDPFIYFFQKGEKKDTLAKTLGDIFYLFVPDSLKNVISIYVENGQLLATNNDSLFRLHFVRGIKYESLFSLKETRNTGNKDLEKFEFKTLVNGSSTLSENKIKVQIYNRVLNELVLENSFIYRD